jgi:hypothetical protein
MLAGGTITRLLKIYRPADTSVYFFGKQEKQKLLFFNGVDSEKVYVVIKKALVLVAALPFKRHSLTKQK